MCCDTEHGPSCCFPSFDDLRPRFQGFGRATTSLSLNHFVDGCQEPTIIAGVRTHGVLVFSSITESTAWSERRVWDGYHPCSQSTRSETC